MRALTHSKGDKAVQEAIQSIGGLQRTATIVLFFAAARRLAATFDAETAAELAYMMADDIATGTHFSERGQR